MKPFKNRREAGEKLSEKLQIFADSPDTVVLALPRGGVPVAFEVAQRLNLPLDILCVRKIGLPGYEELALGATASGGAIVLNKPLVERLQISESSIEKLVARKQKELDALEQLYRPNRPFPMLQGQNVILMDDGIATGSTMRAAISAVRQHGAKFVVVATPVAPASTAREMRKEADEFFSLTTPAEFTAVGEWYQDFSQTSDADVRDCLEKSERFGHAITT